MEVRQSTWAGCSGIYLLIFNLSIEDMENKAQQKRIELGGKLYEDFVDTLADIFGLSAKVSNPTTNKCELFALLSKKENLADLLYKEMASEYFGNYLNIEMDVQKGRIVSKITMWEQI